MRDRYSSAGLFLSRAEVVLYTSFLLNCRCMKQDPTTSYEVCFYFAYSCINSQG